MKKIVLVVISVLLIVGAAGAVLADKGLKGKFDAKSGDAVYVCACGESCTCGTLAKSEGTCGCGQKLVKSAVTRVDKGKVYYQLDGKELSAPQMGKYACGCGDSCGCGTISQKAGKCGCGKDLVKVGKS
jgi:hypothetical protein